MKRILASATLILAASCGGPKAPDPTVGTATAPSTPPTPEAPATPPAGTATATAPPAAATSDPAPTASATPASTTASSALDAGTSVKMDGGKVVVTNAIDISDKGGAPSSSRAPGEVIGGLRPLFNQCFKDGMKKDPKLAGSVTMSAKIGQDGKVTAVTPKRLDGLNDATVKCLSDKLKTAQFAGAGTPGYAASIDIPLSFSSSM